jgi:hypothetical protein
MARILNIRMGRMDHMALANIPIMVPAPMVLDNMEACTRIHMEL